MPRGSLRVVTDRGGMTLIEVIVVLVLLGLASALAAPAFAPPRRPPADAVQDVVERARRAAVGRAGAVTLSLEADGGWTVEAEAGGDDRPLLSGQVGTAPGFGIRLHVSALGACTLAPRQATEASITIDPVRCRLRASPALP